MTEKQALTRQKKKLTERIKLKGAYDETFNSPNGRIVLQHLCENAGISNFKDVKKNKEMWIEHGMRRIVFSILRELAQDPKDILEQAEQRMKSRYEDRT